jgi:hypothetical protein
VDGEAEVVFDTDLAGGRYHHLATRARCLRCQQEVHLRGSEEAPLPPGTPAELSIERQPRHPSILTARGDHQAQPSSMKDDPSVAAPGPLSAGTLSAFSRNGLSGMTG